MDKISLKPVSGTRDFGPREVRRRRHIFDTLRGVFELFGFAPIETPAMERLDVLTGKYGDEGDQLIFKVLNSGPFWEGVKPGTELSSRALLPQLAEKALRYDLTVPFARYVVAHRNDITLPFKRYQMQPVWRADRPQRGRYREFWQCDVDVVGSPSLLFEAEFVQIYDLGLSRLGLTDFTIKINHRKLLQAVAEAAGAPERFSDICVAIDKLDKIGRLKVEAELAERGLAPQQVAALAPVFELGAKPLHLQLPLIHKAYAHTPSGAQALADLSQLAQSLAGVPLTAKLELDATLARGLNYYTGLIFEVKANGVEMGSIGGGGRYDDLTGIFGWEGLTGVGVSFGADRIYDVLEALNLFPAEVEAGAAPSLLVANFGGEAFAHALGLLRQLRLAGIRAEAYPEPAKLAKQFGYADKRGIPYVLVVGDSEMAAGQYALKHLATGQQHTVDPQALLAHLGSA
jgi:histidyl-tRNA synthetase